MEQQAEYRLPGFKSDTNFLKHTLRQGTTCRVCIIGSLSDQRSLLALGPMPRLVAEDIAVALKQRISAGEWAASGRMPPERDLASEFGVARNTIRRAVDQLEEAGMVAREVGRGTF